MALIAIIGYLLLADKFNDMLSSKQDLKKTDQIIPASTASLSDTTAVKTIDVDSSLTNGQIHIQDENISEDKHIAEEEIAPTQPSDEKVYDTISKTRYLTTMAKAHYGNYNLWPYIYEENKAMLGHPDRIRPGTRVIIPSLSKYGVNPNNPEDIKRAKQKGVEIYARFNK